MSLQLPPALQPDLQPARQPYLSIRNLVKEFDGVRAVDDVSLAIDQGDIFALLGSSGCGKSTLLRMLAGFEQPSLGQITLAGQDLVDVPPWQRPINMMFQSYALFPHLSAWDNIAFGLRRTAMPKDQVAIRVEQMLALVQLTGYGKRKPHQLSGGQQQRVALARSLAKRPQLLLLDEPLGALDRKLRESTQIELLNILEQVGVTCVMVTHDQDEAISMATRIGVMHQGRILQVGAPRDIYEAPNCRFVADFIGSVNLFPGRIVSAQPGHAVIDAAPCSLFVERCDVGAVGSAVTAALRPEKMVLQIEAPAPSQRVAALEHGHNCAQGVLGAIVYFGDQTRYHVLLDGGVEVKVVRTNAARHDSVRLARGQRVFVWWDGADIMLLAN